jgi:Na+-translocating ferredoxin:NAD+ oxidoreductase RnfD subunit
LVQGCSSCAAASTFWGSPNSISGRRSCFSASAGTFLFVGATTLLTRTYDAREKAKVQALNDFLIFGTVALSSFSSGALLTGFGWSMVQLAVLPFVVIAAVAVLWLKLRAWRVPAPHYAGL